MTREEKLNNAMRQHRQLLNDRLSLVTDFNRAQRRLQKMNRKIRDVGNAIYDLKQSGDTPEVTDHAIVRYLERVEKVDIRELKLKVAADKNAYREVNVIVTVKEEVEKL